MGVWGNYDDLQFRSRPAESNGVIKGGPRITVIHEPRLAADLERRLVVDLPGGRGGWISGPGETHGLLEPLRPVVLGGQPSHHCRV